MVQLAWSSVPVVSLMVIALVLIVTPLVVSLMVISLVVLLMVISSGATVGFFEQSPERKLHIITSHDK